MEWSIFSPIRINQNAQGSDCWRSCQLSENICNPSLGSVYQIAGDEKLFLLKRNYEFLLDSELNFSHMVEEMMATVNGTEQVKI